MDFSKTALYQRTRSCYDKLYLEFNEKKGYKRVRKDEGNREEDKTRKSSEMGLKRVKIGFLGKTEKNLGKVSNKGKNVKLVDQFIDDSESEDDEEEEDDDDDDDDDYDDKEFVIDDDDDDDDDDDEEEEEEEEDDDDDDDVKLISKKCERKQSKPDVERVFVSGKGKKKLVKDSGAAVNRDCISGKRGLRETLKGGRKCLRTNDAHLTKSIGRNGKKDADVGFSGCEIDVESDDEEGVLYLGDNVSCLDNFDLSHSSRVASNEVKVSPVVELDSIWVDEDGDSSQTFKLSEEEKEDNSHQKTESHEQNNSVGRDMEPTEDDDDDVTIASLSSSSDYDEDGSAMDDGDNDYDNNEGTKNKNGTIVFEPAVRKKKHDGGIDILGKAKEEGGLKTKRRRTDDTDAFVPSVDEMGNRKAAGTTATARKHHHRFGNEFDVSKILTDTLREDGDGGDKLLRSYMISKEEPALDRSSPLKETPVKKFVRSHKFRFKDDEEDITKPEKPESEVAVDKLFEDMKVNLQCLEMGCSSTTAVNCGDADVAITKTTTSCREGKHRLTLNDEFGIICRCCSYVEMEIRDILPPLSKNGTGGYGRHRYDDRTEDGMKFSDLPAANCSDARGTNYGDKGTVWDLVPGVKESMYPHQREGFEFIWKKIAGGTYIDKLEKRLPVGGSGCIINHAPGTGKSRLTIVFLQAFLKMYPDARPVIVAPRSMLLTWEEEFKKWNVDFPFYNLNSHECSGQEDTVALNVVKRFGNVRSIHCNRLLKLYSWKRKSSVLGITYRLFEILAGDEDGRKRKKVSSSSEVKEILLQVPSLLVLDEGHTPRNDESLMWKALLNGKTNRRIILSGTPFQNNLDELYNTLCLVNPLLLSFFGLSSTLRRDHRSSKKKARGQWDYSITSSSFKRSQPKIHEIKAMVDPFVHVHKGTILQETLPGLRDALVVLKPTEMQQMLLGKMFGGKPNLDMDYVMSLVSIHPSLIPTNSVANEGRLFKTLKASKNDPAAGVKTNFLMELIKLSEALNEKVLVFCQFIKPLKFLKKLFKTKFSWAEGRDFLYMDGQQEEKRRQNSISTLNDPKSEVKLLLASIKACSEGINLVGASRVVLLDVHWNPSVERQAISRAYRLGQKKVVYIYHLVTGSMEGEKYIRQVKKSHLSELVFSSKNKEDGSGQPKISSSSTVSEDRILEEMARHEKLRGMFEKVIYQPKEAEDLFDTFG